MSLTMVFADEDRITSLSSQVMKLMITASVYSFNFIITQNSSSMLKLNTRIVAYTLLNVCENILRFLSSTK